MLEDPIYIATILAILTFTADWLALNTALRRVGSTLIVIVLGAVSSNSGVIPAASGTPLYGYIFEYLAPLAIFWLLLQVNLRQILRAGAPMLLAFTLGTVGTVCGVVAGMALAGGADAFEEHYGPLAGMFAGTYIGGGINFNAIALEYGVVKTGGTYAGAVAVDNIVTALWMVLCLAAPQALAHLWPAGGRSVASTTTASPDADSTPSSHRSDDAQLIGPGALGLLFALGLGALIVRDTIVAMAADAGVAVPGMLVLTAIAIVLAQLPPIERIRGAHTLGMFGVNVFLAVIGALCSVAALTSLGGLGVRLAILAGTTVVVHGVIVFGIGRLLRLDLDTLTIASQANIGGATTALALARVLRRPDLAVPGILVGSLGTAWGTFVGFWLAATL